MMPVFGMLAGVLTAAMMVLPQSPSPWLLVICGVGGDAAHREAFDGRAQALMTAATARYGVDETRVIYLAERPADVLGATARADAAGIREAFETIAAGSVPGDLVLVVLLGHGSAQEPAGRFNVLGPDLGPADFETHLQLLGGRRIGFVNTTSTSGGFLELAAPGRVVITATANLREREEPRFGEFFVEAFAALRRGVRRWRCRPRQGRADLAGRGLRVRLPRGGAFLRGQRTHAARARDARGQRRRLAVAGTVGGCG